MHEELSHKLTAIYVSQINGSRARAAMRDRNCSIALTHAQGALYEG